MINRAFSEIYAKFKLYNYRMIFEKIKSRETSLSTVETFCVEIIYAMDNPTISEFSSFIGISSPNAAYKVTSLVRKGYIRRVRSEVDKREYHLEVTEKYMNYYNISASYINLVMKRMQERFTEEELKTLEKILDVTSKELMPELNVIEKIRL